MLGGVAIEVGGKVVVAPGRRQTELLALLAFRKGDTVPTGWLVERLWRDDLPRQPEAALHSLVARTRRWLEDLDAGPWIVTTRHGYSLGSQVAVDAERFERLMIAAIGAVTPDVAVELLTEATGLWRGEAFTGVSDIEDLDLEAIRLSEQRLLAEERLGAGLVDAGRAGEAVGLLERLVEAEPFREGAVAALMRALQGAGRQAEALQRFQGYRHRLADELGLDPSPALRRLESEVATTPPGPDSWRPDSPLESLRITYTSSGRHPELRLAVGSTGQGRTIVSLPAWVTSLDVIAAGRDPRSALVEQLASTERVVLYDQPGTGLSNGPVSDYSLAGAVLDLESVVDHIGGEPTVLLAMSAAGPAALTFAARHPALVRGLVLFGTFADPRVAFPDPAFASALVGIVRARWGRGASMLAQLFRPGVSDAGAQRLAEVLRASAGADAGAGYLQAVYESDAGPVLPQVEHPALVIHYRNDKVIPFAGGEHLARSLPNARFVPLDGGYHLPDVRDTVRLHHLIRTFLDEVDPPLL